MSGQDREIEGRGWFGIQKRTERGNEKDNYLYVASQITMLRREIQCDISVNESDEASYLMYGGCQASK